MPSQIPRKLKIVWGNIGAICLHMRGFYKFGPGLLRNTQSRTANLIAEKLKLIEARKFLLLKKMSFVAIILVFFTVFTQSMFHSKNGCLICKNKWQKDKPFLPAWSYRHSFTAVLDFNMPSHEINSDADLCRKCYQLICKWERTGHTSQKF